MEVRSLVEDELRRWILVDDETRLWEASYRRVRDGVRLLVCRTGGQYLSSCFAPKARTPGGDGVMSPSQIRKVRRNSLSRTFLPTLRAVRPADVAQRGRAARALDLGGEV